MKRKPNDYDIATNALPEEIITVFGEKNAIPTGIKYGTVTVLHKGASVEITHYRYDGNYSDHRCPDEVTFVSDIHQDLLRRDFTINAMALGSDGNLIDDFNGKEHIEQHIITCVGDPYERFNEDALRIMRAVRFSAQLGFEIESQTAEAIKKYCNTLNNISAERLREELERMICGDNSYNSLMNYCEVITQFIPELEKTIGFDQHSPYHKYDVWEHTAKAVSAAENDRIIRLTMLLHDVAKPLTFHMDENGRGHFNEHAHVGAKVAETILKRLKYDNKTVSDVTTLIYHHSDFSKNIDCDTDIKKLYSEIGERLFFILLDVNRADNSAKNDFVLKELELIDEMEKKALSYKETNECLFINQLEVNGNDLKNLGLNGKEIGSALNMLLCAVIEGKIQNKKEELIMYIKTASNMN